MFQSYKPFITSFLIKGVHLEIMYVTTLWMILRKNRQIVIVCSLCQVHCRCRQPSYEIYDKPGGSPM